MNNAVVTSSIVTRWATLIAKLYISLALASRLVLASRARGSPAGVPRLCVAAPPAASGPASPVSWSEPPPAEMGEIKARHQWLQCSKKSTAMVKTMCSSYLAD